MEKKKERGSKGKGDTIMVKDTKTIDKPKGRGGGIISSSLGECLQLCHRSSSISSLYNHNPFSPLLTLSRLYVYEYIYSGRVLRIILESIF